MNNLTVRILFVLVAIPVLIALLSFNQWSRFAVVLIIASAGAWEFSRMVESRFKNVMGIRWISVLSTALLILVHFLEPNLLLPVFSFILISYILISFKLVDIDQLFPWLSLQLAGVLYLGLWFGYSLVLFLDADGLSAAYPFLYVNMLMWVCDTGAYAAGKFFGKHKLCPGISPKKTWEGAFGGTLSVFILAGFLGPAMTGVGLGVSMIIATIVSITAPTGDLVMSALKRYTGYKDSSALLPGHGGVLDRFDSLFLSAPVVVAILGLQEFLK
jgi:phosphatidate cytidylyltransferase